MYIIKSGRKLKRAWKLYECSKCGEMGITLKRDAATALFPRMKVSDILIEPEDPSDKLRKCKNCGNKMDEASMFAENYKGTFYHLNVNLTGDNTIHVITEDELYY